MKLAKTLAEDAIRTAVSDWKDKQQKQGKIYI